jgi:hypothetical protein
MQRLLGLMLVAAVIAAAAGTTPAAATATTDYTCGGADATIVGTDGDDVLTGTTGPDVIVGLGGKDEIRGLGGDDIICGGDGADRIFGGGGSDDLRGGGGPDEIDGGAGADSLSGSRGNDILSGGDGPDEIVGGSGNDEARGGGGFDTCDTERRSGCDRIALEPGDRGVAVRQLQQSLTDALVYRGPINGRYDDKTAAAVITFHKVIERPRTDTWQEADWDRIAEFEPRVPKRRTNEPDRVEVDIGHQVVYLIEGDEVAAIMATSTGGGYLYYSKRVEAWVSAWTPRGSFRFFNHANGWNCDPLYGWCIYEPWSFTTGYALHGYSSVPPYPASHGCVRVHNWEADWLEDHLSIGMRIHIWD